jgi:hypothetical protein
MLDQAALRVGDRVHYQPDHYQNNEWENGMIREIPSHTNESVRVVFHCAGDWRNFKNYTSALTNLRDLKKGWRH